MPIQIFDSAVKVTCPGSLECLMHLALQLFLGDQNYQLALADSAGKEQLSVEFVVLEGLCSASSESLCQWMLKEWRILVS